METSIPDRLLLGWELRLHVLERFRCCVDSSDLHSELCNQVTFRIRAKTWALGNFNSAVDYRYGLGVWRCAKVREHPLKR